MKDLEEKVRDLENMVGNQRNTIDMKNAEIEDLKKKLMAEKLKKKAIEGPSTDSALSSPVLPDPAAAKRPYSNLLKASVVSLMAMITYFRSTHFVLDYLASLVSFVGLSDQVFPPRPNSIPDHMLNTRVVYQTDFLTEDMAAELRNLTKEMKNFPTNLSDLKFYKTTHEHIGEAVPLEADGSCANPLLMASINKTSCVLPGRVDVGRHWIMTGGPSALREPYSSMVTRASSFGSFNFDLNKHKIIDELF